MDWIGQTPGVGQGLMSLMGNANGGVGYSAPGDPNVTGGALSPGAYDRAINSLGTSAAYGVGRAGLGALAGYAMGMPGSMLGQAAISSLAGPTSVLGMVSSPVKSALGIGPTSVPGKIASKAVPGALGMVAGPVGGLLGSVLGDFAIDGIMDGLDLRSDEKRRDQYENDWGYAAGRAAHKDRRDIMSKAAKVREAIPNSMAAIKAADEAIQQAAALEAAMHNRMNTTNPSLSSADRMGSYGGWGNVGGPMGGARAVDPGYGPSMGGFAGLGIGNPSSYGGRGGSANDRGGFGANDGNSDTAGNAGFGR